MQILSRNVDFLNYLKKKSFFLLGPRATGKSFWIKQCLKNAKAKVTYIDLLKGRLQTRLTESPELLEQMMDADDASMCIIDEIQKLPSLLNEVHRLIEDRQFRFMLTGSSARKLKRENANMLGGRASLMHFFQLSSSEIPKFSLERFLLVGGLPQVYLSSQPFDHLEDYVSTYLEQEIKLEANLRNLGPFQRFLKVAALYSGEMINYSNVSNDCGIPLSTVRDYFQILEDTLIGFVLEPWIESKKRKAIQTAKFYLFDPGLQNVLTDTKHLDRNSDRWGKLFETFILIELRAYDSYRQQRKKFYYWRSVNRQEVDFVIDDKIAVEVKSTNKITPRHLTGLRAIQEEKIIEKCFIISNDPIARIDEGVSILPWQLFLEKLWTGKIF